MRLRPSCGRDFPSCDAVSITIMDRRDTAFEGALLICSNGDRELERIRFFWSLTEKNGAKVSRRAGSGSKYGTVKLLLERRIQFN